MESAFLNFFGDNPNSRLLEFLITGRDFDYSLTDLAENAGIGWTTLHRIFPLFEKQGIILQTRTIGRAKLFKLNLQNDEVKKLINLFDGLLAKQLNASIEKSEKVLIKQKILARA